MNDICKSEAETVLLVEGKDDCHVILALARHYRLAEKFGIYDCGSDLEVLKRLNALIVSSEFVRPQTIGVALDVKEGRWAQLTGKIARHGYEFPAVPDPNGTILEGDDTKPRIGVWIMPDNSNEGMLEDFLLAGVPAAGLDVAIEAVELAKRKQVTTFKDVHFSKAVIHTYLAWQDEPGRPLGLSVTSKSCPLKRPRQNVSLPGWANSFLEPLGI